MRLSNSYFFTLRENVKDEESKSGNLLVRAGMITKIGSGIYSFLPLGLKVLKNIEKIVREEMNNSGAEELLMPSLLPIDYYVESGRADKFGSNMFNLNDRYKRPYVLGPTHEELFTVAAKLKIKSYKDMPFNLYQIANKYRDEMRPRFGLIRVREFIMKDAYSFDRDEKGLGISYEKMYNAYKRIFDRVGLNYRIVAADCGTMGGSLSEEFQAICDIGEDILCYCESCDYSTNLEVGTFLKNRHEKEDFKDIILKNTPNVKTIEEVASFLNKPVDKIVKTLMYNVDKELYAVVLPGKYEVNETKLGKILNATEIRLATEEEIKNAGSVVGYVGPVNIKVPVILDEEVADMYNFVVGANEIDKHLENVNIKDFEYKLIADVKTLQEGDLCPKCGNKILFTKGIEVGNTFKLGTKYSEALGLKYLDEENKLQPVVMGCYGIGLARIMAAIAEQKATENNLNWPINIAPYKIAIIPINTKDELQMEIANKLYEELANYEVLIDDRNERAGVKFNDMELIGIPIKIIVGKNAVNHEVEIKYNDHTEIISLNKLNEKLKEIIKL
ncbi:MAG: proline--tRNA ligase [Firmicutes bacterium]|nr:proline--tRNA ligase [Bacillota bacterium]